MLLHFLKNYVRIEKGRGVNGGLLSNVGAARAQAFLCPS
jgi:hypothetical protein